MLAMLIRYFVALLVLFPQVGFASSVVIHFNKVLRPAKDLVYQGKSIDVDTAAQLKKEGHDISVLNPNESDIWQDEKFSSTNESQLGFPLSEHPRLIYDSLITSPSLMTEDEKRNRTSAYSHHLLRVRVTENDKPYRMVLSLQAHAALMKTALLRKIGYPIPSIKHYDKVTLVFENDELLTDKEGKKYFRKRADFEGFAARMHRAQEKRWVIDKPADRSELTLQDVVLETARVEVPTIQWGATQESHMDNRRALRARIIPLVLLDLPESVNLFSPDAGFIANDAAILNHPFAHAYAQITIDDARWIMRKIAALTRDDFAEIVELGKWPPEVAAIYLEKIISRRNNLIEILKMKDSLPPGVPVTIPCDININTENVVDGKLTKDSYAGYAQRFSWGDPESPLTTEEITRFVGMTGLSSGISQAVSEINKNLAFYAVEEATAAHLQTLQESLITHIKTNPTKPFEGAVKTWGGPLFGLNVDASRNIVTGTYYGSDPTLSQTPLQLVDIVGGRVHLGYFFGVDTLNPAYIPTFIPSVSVGRTYVHVRPVGSVKAAMQEDWKNLFVPGFMRGLGNILKASEIMQDLDPATLKDAEKVKKAEELNTAIVKFLKEFREGEVLTITDTLSPDISGQIRFPLAAFMPASPGNMNPMFVVGVGVNGVVLSRTTITRTNDSIHVYLQNMNSAALRFTIDARFWIKIVEVAKQFKKGYASTRAYLISSDPKGFEDNHKFATSFETLIKHNDADLIEYNYSPFRLKHEVNSVTDSFRFLFWSRFNLERGHLLRVTPPNNPQEPIDPNEYERVFYSKTAKDYKGIRYLNVISDLLGFSFERDVTIQDNPGPNPAHSFFGKAFNTELTTDAEITNNKLENPVTTSVQSWQGWILSSKSLKNILNSINNSLRHANGGVDVVHKDAFHMTEDIQFYNIRARLLIFEGAMKRLIDSIVDSADRPPIYVGDPRRLRKIEDRFTVTDAQVVETLKDIMGRDEFLAYCRSIAPDHKYKANSWLMNAYHYGYQHECLTEWMIKILSLRREYPVNSPQEEIDWINKLIGTLNQHIDTGRWLSWVGKKNFTFQVVVNGFRTVDENGDKEFYSNSLGIADSKAGEGAFKNFINKYKILANEVNASYIDESY